MLPLQPIHPKQLYFASVSPLSPQHRAQSCWDRPAFYSTAVSSFPLGLALTGALGSKQTDTLETVISEMDTSETVTSETGGHSLKVAQLRVRVEPGQQAGPRSVGR